MVWLTNGNHVRTDCRTTGGEGVGGWIDVESRTSFKDRVKPTCMSRPRQGRRGHAVDQQGRRTGCWEPSV